MKTVIVMAICLLSTLCVPAQNHSELTAIKNEIVKTYMDLRLQAPNPNKDFSIYQKDEHEIVFVTIPESQPASLFMYDKLNDTWVLSHKFFEFNATSDKVSDRSTTKDNVVVTPYSKGYLITCEVSSGDNRNFKQWIEVYKYSNDTLHFVGKIDFFEFHQSDIYPIKRINYSGFYKFNNTNKSSTPTIMINRTYNDGVNKVLKYKLNMAKDKYIISDTITIPSDSKLIGDN